MKNWIIAALVAVIAVGGAVGFAQSSRTANVEVRVWEDVNDPERNYISARPEGGSWRTLGTIPLPLTDGVSSSGRFRYGDITLAVPLPDGAARSAPAPTPSQTSTPTPSPTATAAPVASGPTRPVLGEHFQLNGLSYRAQRDPIDNVLTTAVSSSTQYRDAYGLDQRAIFAIFCTNGGEIQAGLSTDEYHRSGTITYRIDGNASVQETWVPVGKNLFWDPADRMFERLRGASRLLIRTSEINLLAFDVAGFHQTPVQPNMENCGRPGWR